MYNTEDIVGIWSTVVVNSWNWHNNFEYGQPCKRSWHQNIKEASVWHFSYIWHLSNICFEDNLRKCFYKTFKIHLYFLDDLCSIRKNRPSGLKHFSGSKASNAVLIQLSYKNQSHNEATGSHQVKTSHLAKDLMILIDFLMKLNDFSPRSWCSRFF